MKKKSSRPIPKKRKVTKNKTSKKAPKKQEPKKDNKLIIIGIIAILGILIVVYMATQSSIFNMNDGENAKGQDSIPQSNAVLAATVNGIDISAAEIDKKYDKLPDQFKNTITKEVLLNQTINEMILLSEAEKQGITVSEAEVSERIDLLREGSGLSQEDFNNQMQTEGLTMDDLRAFYYKELLIVKLLDSEVVSKAQISEQEIEDYYVENINEYTIPKGYNVSHILICHNESVRCISNLSKEEALAKIQDIRENIDDFGEAAAMYSNEPGAAERKGSIGIINEESPIDPNFMAVVLNLKPGVISDVVETQFGYHLIYVSNILDEDTLSLDAVSADIESLLKAQKQQDMFDLYISKLRKNANIIIY